MSGIEDYVGNVLFNEIFVDFEGVLFFNVEEGVSVCIICLEIDFCFVDLKFFGVLLWCCVEFGNDFVFVE